MKDDLSVMRDAFAAKLNEARFVSDPLWLAALREVPRHQFLPTFFTSTPDGSWQAVDATDGTYFPEVYADTTLTTQVDGKLDPDPSAGPVKGEGTSSSTQPGLMAYMLEALNVTGAERVLEIGTGTGYNAALLSHRLGADRVTTVEVDPHVAELARERLKACSYEPRVETRSGEDGFPDAAPFDRVIATCSFPHVPRTWIDQTRDGGHIVTSLWRDLGGGPMVRLTVNEGVAEGNFLAVPGGFMPTRSVNRASQALSEAVQQTGQTRTALVDSGVLRESHAGMWLALLVPDATWLGFTPTGGSQQLWLFASDGSWSMLEDSTMTVEQYGPRRLWDEIEAAYNRWHDAGSPDRERLGLTVSADGVHHFWLDDPSNELWRTSA